MSVAPVLGDGLVIRCLEVRSSDVVWLKAILDAHDGLGCLFSRGGGSLLLVCPASRGAELDELLVDIVSELPGVTVSFAGDAAQAQRAGIA